MSRYNPEFQPLTEEHIEITLKSNRSPAMQKSGLSHLGINTGNHGKPSVRLTLHYLYSGKQETD